MYTLTLFKNRYDNKTHKTMSFETWDEFVSLLFMLSEKPDTKATAPLISPATYEEGTTRSNKNVELWGKWALSVLVIGISFVIVRRLVPWIDRSSALYSILWRLYIKIKSPSSGTHSIPNSIRLETGKLKTLAVCTDRQTKDLSRMYYVPAKYDNAHNFIFRNAGRPIDVDYLVVKHPYRERTGNTFLDRLPEELQKAVVEHRKSQMDNTNVTWTTYKDCPFFPRKLAMEYVTISETGWYHKLYQIMVATASNAIKKGYPITAREIAELCRQLDMDNGNWYTGRPLEVEADRAVEYAYRNN
jgi:hypothetical protein